MGEPRKPSPMRRWLFGSAWIAGLAAALVAAAASWLLATTSGARFALERAVALAGGRVVAVEGTLAGPLSVGSIAWATPKLRLRAERVALDWSPLRLLGGEVRILRLHAVAVEIDTVAASGAARKPATLALPLRLFVAQAGVDRLRMGTIGDEQGGVELREVSLKLAADGAAWILGGAEAATPVGRATLSGTVGSRAPFPVDMKGELVGKRNDAPYRATIEAKGPLANLEARLAVREGGLSGTGAASLEPFSEFPLRRLLAKLEGVDIAGFSAAPHTRLTMAVDLAPAGAAFLAGPVTITNADPGPLDMGRLPVASAAAQLVIAKNRVEARNLVLAMAKGGGATGQAAWSGGKLDAKLFVKDADLLAWHTSLKATRLTGDITASATGEVQAFRVALADPRFGIRGDASIAQGLLTVERARLARGAAFAEAKGTLALRGTREFVAEGRIERLDPAAFANVPAGQLSATFTAKGSLAKGLVGEALLEIAKSRYAGMDAQGRVALDAEGERLSRVEADVSLGATRVVAKGALGLAGDTLDVKVASPDLAPIGRAFGIALGGRVDLDARISGTFAALSGRAAFDAKDLALPGAIRLAAATGRLELGSGDAGAANAQVDLLGLARGGEKAALVERASLVLKGTRRSHEMRVEADLPDKSSLRALFDGGVVPGARLPEWHGRLESLATTGRTSLALSAPATLVVSAGRVELGEAVFAGEPGEMRLAVTRWTPGRLESRGSSNAIVVRAIRRILNLQGEAGSNLVLAGEWDVRVGDSVDGFVSVRRERGDVRVGDPRQALGLETLTLRADASGGRVKANIDVRGKQAGLLRGEASAMLRRGDDGWEVSPLAPIEGRFAVDVPDLSWTAAWFGPEARAGGRLKGEGTLAGTAREPAWRGRLEATGLVIRDPALGAEVADGTIAIVLEDREARIERFALSMPWQPTDEAARAISAAKRPAAGTVTAEGAVDLGTRKGTIRVKAAAWPLTRLATRFLAVTGESRVDLDGTTTVVAGEFTVDAGWFGIPASAPPALSDDVIVDRGAEAPAAARSAERVRLGLRVDLGEHLYFRGRGLATRLAGSLRLAGDVGVNLRTTGTIRAVGGTYDAYGRTLAIERGSLNFQGPVDNPGINVLALRKGLPVEAGVEVLGTVARPKVRLYSSPDVADPDKLTWLVLGRGQGDISAGDAATLVEAANALLGRDTPASEKLLGRLGFDDFRLGRDESGLLGTMPQSTVAGRTRTASAAEVVSVGKRLTDDIYVSYQQGLADAEGSLRVAWQLTRSLQLILRAGHLPGIDAVYRFSFH
jgi:translocation and assembly module TamB